MKKMHIQLEKILKLPLSSYESFHARTALEKSRQHKVRQIKIYFKAYDRFKAIRLGKSPLPPFSLNDALAKRKSNRDVDPVGNLNLNDLGSLLHHSAGIRESRSAYEGYRSYPSAGGRFPLEIYVIPNRVEGLSKGGVYHYNVKGGYMEERLAIAGQSIKNCFQQQFAYRSDCLIIVTGIFKRTTMKYGERGYRYVLMESGHIGQNLYLVGAALRLNICGICGFYDKPLNDYLHLDGVSESALYCFTVNKS